MHRFSGESLIKIIDQGRGALRQGIASVNAISSGLSFQSLVSGSSAARSVLCCA
jgi:hypothetical protein